jgi:hypothetical protein
MSEQDPNEKSAYIDNLLAGLLLACVATTSLITLQPHKEEP